MDQHVGTSAWLPWVYTPPEGLMDRRSAANTNTTASMEVRKTDPLRPSENEVFPYLSGECGVFAYALWLELGKPENATLDVLSNIFDDPWSRKAPFAFTHVYLSLGGTDVDAVGARAHQDMAESLGCAGSYEVHDGYAPAQFRRSYMGNSGRFPLYGDRALIRDARAFIRKFEIYYAIACGVDRLAGAPA